MVVATTATLETATSDEVRPRLFTIDEVVEMARVGILRPNERVELIEGQIVEMHAQGTRHVWAVSRLMTWFARQDGVLVTAQSTFEITGQNGPEPDVVVLRASTTQFKRPSPPDTLLIIEVSDTSLAYDRNTKRPLY